MPATATGAALATGAEIGSVPDRSGAEEEAATGAARAGFAAWRAMPMLRARRCWCAGTTWRRRIRWIPCETPLGGGKPLQEARRRICRGARFVIWLVGARA
ncbi:hypothetical protein LNKW23_22620 [Paralimibaculum aggregatum]|uniref:Aldehyde dehydrogenase family protein n=1 Tax=Paralimibaculum aggregatum TaxID=3036245 RepID=A0ABQ6LL86_9RHOB|nr:hypothetical protein LNKW23_22620 [Limibaculum sp. NKW23]